MLDTLIVFGLLGAIAVFVLYVLPRQSDAEQPPVRHGAMRD